MSSGDGITHIGGARQDFPTTNWGRFLDSRTGGPPQADDPIEFLVAEYWKPIYAYIRSKWARSNEDAKDLTQDFFLWMIEGDFVQRADRTRGRFRSFVKVALAHYLANEHRKEGRLKRGGDRKTFQIGGAPDSLEFQDPQGRTPDEVLDDAWKTQLLSRAEETLEQAYRNEGRQTYFAIFRDYYLCESEELDYKEVAARHGVTPVDVSNFLMNAKKRFRAILTDLVAETVRSPEDLQEELRALFGDEEK